MGWIDARDIAGVAAALLTSDLASLAPTERDYLLTGPRALSYRETASIIAAKTGRPIQVIETDELQQAAGLRALGVPAEFAEMLARADAEMGVGRHDDISTAVEQLTGRSPRAFADFVDDHAAEWRVDA